ncbi:hypothetical protein BsWGS_25101 [Bradybaena similaris]
MAERTEDVEGFQETANYSAAHCQPGDDADLKDLASFDPNEAMSELEAAYEDEFEISLRHIRRCPKQGRHGEFIPIREFSIDNLDPPYKDESIVELVKKMAALTVRLQVRKLSTIRPEPPYPPDRRVNAKGAACVINGTGFVDNAFIITEDSGKLCPCRECKESGSPRTRWGKVDIKTAGHVVHDCFEAEETICYFDFDEDGTDPASIPSLIGSKDSVGVCSHADDQFKVIFYTHDIDFAEKLRKLADTFTVQQQILVRKHHRGSDSQVPDVNFYHKVVDLLCSKIANGDSAAQTLHLAFDHFGGMLNARVQEHCPTIPSNMQTAGSLVIVVSHPHGCGKYVSLGQFNSRKTLPNDFDPGSGDWLVKSFYLYTTHTCPGSSGAPVFILSKERLGKVCSQVHSKFMSKFGLSRSGFSLEM